jgi:hypothetical protein
MKKKEIQVGGTYTAKVSGKLTTVKVTEIRVRAGHKVDHYSGRSGTRETTVYDVVNLATGRKTTFASAVKFRCMAKQGDKARAFYTQASTPAKEREAAEQPVNPVKSLMPCRGCHKYRRRLTKSGHCENCRTALRLIAQYEITDLPLTPNQATWLGQFVKKLLNY